MAENARALRSNATNTAKNHQAETQASGVIEQTSHVVTDVFIDRTERHGLRQR